MVPGQRGACVACAPWTPCGGLFTNIFSDLTIASEASRTSNRHRPIPLFQVSISHFTLLMTHPVSPVKHSTACLAVVVATVLIPGVRVVVTWASTSVKSSPLSSGPSGVVA